MLQRADTHYIRAAAEPGYLELPSVLQLPAWSGLTRHRVLSERIGAARLKPQMLQ